MATKILANKPIKFGQIAGPEEPVVQFECSASIVFEDAGGKFVALDGSEQLVIAGSTTQELIGWAIAGDFTGSSTAGRLLISVNINTNALYLMPIATADAQVARTEAQLKALIGQVADLDIISNVQYVDIGVSTHDVVQIVDYRYWGSAAGQQAVVVRMTSKEIGQTGV